MRESRRRWFENTVVYSLDVALFSDGDGDGVGDLAGLIDRLDYLAGLGVETIWLLPITRSPNRDNRYDAADLYIVDPTFGDLGDFVRLVHEAGQRGMRVLVELVVNHTSVDHPWFQAARADRRSRYRDYYIWRDDKPEDDGMEPVFPGPENGVWTFDEQAGQWYLHRFYRHQPELNIANPDVQDEIFKVMGFWLRIGAAGFRLDAAPYILEKAAWADDTDDGHWFLRQLHEFVATNGDDAVLLAEADVQPKQYGEYFGDGDEIHLLLNFWSNAALFLALARNDPLPVVDSLRELPVAPPGAAYANWVRNHDELDLEQLTESERNEVLDRFAPDPDMRIYDRGIRRRLPPMLDGDRRRIELTYATMFGLPGVPILRYGEEIGMGDDLSLPERASVRTVMQWSDQISAGFSDRPLDELGVPLITDGPFGFERVHVANQRGDPSSLLNAVHGLIRARRESPELGTGNLRILDALANDGVLGLRYDGPHRSVVVVANFTESTVELDAPELADLREMVELTADSQYEPFEPSSRPLCLGPFGYRWFRCRT